MPPLGPEMTLDQAVRFGPFRFDPVSRLLYKHDIEMALPPRVLAVLESLARQPGVIVSKQELIDAAWKDAHVSDASLAEAVSSLREALGDDPARPTYVQTVHRRGYRFLMPPVEWRPVPSTTNSMTTGAPARRPASGDEAVEAWGLPREPILTRGDRTWILPWLVTAFALITALAALWQAVRLGSTPHQPLARLSVPLAAGETLGPQDSALAISPDGGRVAYIATRDGRRRLFVRTLDRLESQPIAGGDDATAPFFSPDGRWLGFVAEGKLKKVALAGGGAITLAEARSGSGASWGADGTIVFSHNGVLFRVADTGGTPQRIVAPEAGTEDLAYVWPEILPGGRAVLFSIRTPAAPRIAVVSLRTGAKRDLISDGTYGRYAPTGHLIFASAGDLMAAAFDPRRLEISGPAAPILDGVGMNRHDGSAQFAVSRSGTLLYVSDVEEPRRRTLTWIDADGSERALPLPERPYSDLALSPDGRRAAVTISDEGGSELWLADLDHGTLSRLPHRGRGVRPIWTPDGARLVFASSTAGPFNLFWKAVEEGQAGEERLARSPRNQFPDSWSPDGRGLLFTEIDPDTGADLWLLTADGDRRPQPLVRTPWDETSAVFSPDGRSIVYQSNESGRWEIYLTDVPPARKLQISTDGGTAAVWAPDGRRIYYRRAGHLMVADLTPGPARSVTRAKPLVTRADLDEPFAIRDGRLLSIRKARPAVPPSHFNIVLGWFAEVERLVPTPLPKLLR